MREKIALAVAFTLALIATLAINIREDKRMDTYAEANSCEWTYYYDKPICK